MTNQLPQTTTTDSFTAVDARRHRISETQGFDRLELVTRWVLLLIAGSTLAIGVRHWLAGLG